MSKQKTASSMWQLNSLRKDSIYLGARATADGQESMDAVTALPEIPKSNFDEFSLMFSSTA